MADHDAEPLPRWGIITEPMTVFTNLVLALLAFVLTARLAYHSAAIGSGASASLTGGLLATALAAVLGAIAHGTDPAVDAMLRARVWRGALYATGLIGVATIACVAFFAARGAVRTAILVFAGLKLVLFIVQIARRPEFRVAAADYAGALAILLGGATFAAIRWKAAGMSWLIAGVLVSLVAGVVQARRIAFHRHFNHNDVFHVIQMVSLYLFYRGGLLLVDR